MVTRILLVLGLLASPAWSSQMGSQPSKSLMTIFLSASPLSTAEGKVLPPLRMTLRSVFPRGFVVQAVMECDSGTTALLTLANGKSDASLYCESSTATIYESSLCKPTDDSDVKLVFAVVKGAGAGRVYSIILREP